ncbi:putative chaperone DNAJ protein [Trypanosoma cruzi]|uniref:Chaperone DnaJ protein, putative n=2 Tax=Trypanosoma cruzi TaxID=5693 RepID=Q4DFP7_TRYCC|nr:chaperone DnaJ protein, putative [Trypanosoma cruzi]EAN91353.1 chaperone DnaJ protein, putative [Trypanosoma cruzi]PWV07302.1 putative chaperone DNAJ protein [Trypanosoma cruzi]|eukprot:XP_813204.1 chaperone DnaJ protein [Trypanosoma cruzi strain CL Brener]
MRRSWRMFQAAERGPFDPYRILGLSPNAGKEEIKKAYHRLALRYHPDGGPEGSTERFQAVNEAYEALRSGKWRPEKVNKDPMEGKGYGWDPRMGMYVYEQPGSTTENYVDSRTQTILRLCVLWTAAFVVVRFFLLWIFPFSRELPTVEWVAANNVGGTKDARSQTRGLHGNVGTSPHSVHANQDTGFDGALDNSGSTFAHLDADPLRRR